MNSRRDVVAVIGKLAELSTLDDDAFAAVVRELIDASRAMLTSAEKFTWLLGARDRLAVARVENILDVIDSWLQEDTCTRRS